VPPWRGRRWLREETRWQRSAQETVSEVGRASRRRVGRPSATRRREQDAKNIRSVRRKEKRNVFLISGIYM
jgi:hypothetical protein